MGMVGRGTTLYPDGTNESAKNYAMPSDHFFHELCKIRKHLPELWRERKYKRPLSDKLSASDKKKEWNRCPLILRLSTVEHMMQLCHILWAIKVCIG